MLCPIPRLPSMPCSYPGMPGSLGSWWPRAEEALVWVPRLLPGKSTRSSSVLGAQWPKAPPGHRPASAVGPAQVRPPRAGRGRAPAGTRPPSSSSFPRPGDYSLLNCSCPGTQVKSYSAEPSVGVCLEEQGMRRESEKGAGVPLLLHGVQVTANCARVCCQN